MDDLEIQCKYAMHMSVCQMTICKTCNMPFSTSYTYTMYIYICEPQFYSVRVYVHAMPAINVSVEQKSDDNT